MAHAGSVIPPTEPGLSVSLNEELAFFASTHHAFVMNNKHRATLESVFSDPVSGTLDWIAIERLLIACGARMVEGRGSRVRFELNGEIETFHRPHPEREAKRYQVKAARAFLVRLGINP